MITLNANALTTLERLKALMPSINPEEPSPDNALILLINQASSYVEEALGRKLQKTAYIEPHKGNGEQELLLDNYPIVSVEGVIWAGGSIPPGSYDYSRTGRFGVLYKDDGWPYRGYIHGLAGDPVRGSRNLEVYYTAGYTLPQYATEADPATLPADLEGLVIDMVLAAYGKMQTGGNAGLKSFSISDVKWEWQHEAPESWQRIIDMHKRVSI